MFLAVNWGNALIITLFGFAQVFLVLMLLIMLLWLFGKLMTQKKPAQQPAAASTTATDQHALTTQEAVAVAMALHLLFEEAHDKESDVLTIRPEEHHYSPWSSKIYGINNLHN